MGGYIPPLIEMEDDMDIDFNKIEFGEGHGNLFNFFKNIYYENRYIGRTYYNSSFLESKEKTIIYFCGKPWLTKKQIEILESNGCTVDDTAECNETDYPYMKVFMDDEEGAIKWWGEMIDKLEMDIDYYYPAEDILI